MFFRKLFRDIAAVAAFTAGKKRSDFSGGFWGGFVYEVLTPKKKPPKPEPPPRASPHFVPLDPEDDPGPLPPATPSVSEEDAELYERICDLDVFKKLDK